LTEEDLEQELRLTTSISDITASIDSLQLGSEADPLAHHPSSRDKSTEPHDFDDMSASKRSEGGNTGEEGAVDSKNDVLKVSDEEHKDLGSKGDSNLAGMRPDNVD
jgi:hypothetical protein